MIDTPPTKISKIRQSYLSALPTGQADVTIFIIAYIFSFTMYLHRPYFRLGGKDV